MRKRQVHSYGEKRKRIQRGLAELVLLLLQPPSPLLAGPLEVFQRVLLYLIKASQVPGNAPRPAIFLYFLQTQSWYFEGEGADKRSWDTELKQGIQGASICSGY